MLIRRAFVSIMLCISVLLSLTTICVAVGQGSGHGGGTADVHGSAVIVGLPRNHQCERIRIPTCSGLGYNVTSMPNLLHHEDQLQAQHAMQAFESLLQLNCSPHLRLLICSVFVPMCSEEIPNPIQACRSHCLKVRADCEPLVARFRPWPEELDCDQFPETPKMVCIKIPDETDDIPRPPGLQFNHRQEHYFPHGAAPCSRQGDIEDRRFAEKWATGWGWMCYISTLFTLLTWMVEPTRFRYPERPVVFIALCYNFQGIVYILRGALGPTENSGACLTSSVILYYSTLAGATWWVAFILAWWLSAARDWSSEALSSALSPRMHLTCWGGPMLITGCVFLSNIDREPTLGGPCEIKSVLPILIPHSVLLFLICLFASLAGVALVRVRRTLKASGRSAGKLERLMTRLGIYVALYVIPALIWLLCLAYDALRPSDDECDSAAVEVALLKVFSSLVVGVVSGMWVWSNKTCKTWSRLLGAAPAKSRRPMPVSRV